MLISVEKNRFDMLEIVSDAVKSMSEGELLQLQKARKLNIKEEDYFRIIKSKTAALLSACTACGARSVSDDPETNSDDERFRGKHRYCIPDTG